MQLRERVRSGTTEWEFSFPGTRHIWRMQEQKDFGFTRPDFYFSTEDPNIPDLALFLDGASYHISQAHERLHGDIEKRNTLFARNIQPWSLTWKDIEKHKQQRTLPIEEHPRWFNLDLQPNLAAMLNIERSKLDLLPKNPMAQLLGWLKDPDTYTWASLSLAATMHLVSIGQPDTDTSILTTAFAPLTMRYSTVDQQADLRLDTTDGIAENHWNEFLTLSNLIYARGEHISVHTDRTESPAAAETPAMPAVTEPSPSAGSETTAVLSEQWQTIRDEFDDEPEVAECLLRLGMQHITPPDSYGEELGGISSIAIWNGPKIALVFEHSDELEHALIADSWQFFSPEELAADDLPKDFHVLKEHA